MSKRRTKKVRITKGEKMLYFLGSSSLVITLIVQIFCGANMGSLNLKVEKLKYDINSQNKKNESLTMKVNELTSFDKVKDIVKDMGLAYNNDNIVVINDNQ